MKLFTLTLFFLISSAFVAVAQYNTGYIITMEMDTIQGKIAYFGGMCTLLKPDGSSTEYSVKELYGFRYSEGDFYIAKEWNSAPVFMEYLIKGELNVYFYRKNYYVEKSGAPLTEITYAEEKRRIENQNVRFTSKKHIGILKVFTAEVPELVAEIEKIEKPNHKDLINLAKDYHVAVTAAESYVVFRHSPKKLNYYWEPALGALLIKDLPKVFYSEAEVSFYMKSSNPENRLYIKTGLIYNQNLVKLDEYKYLLLFKVPVQMYFIYPFKKIQPKIGFGPQLIFSYDDVYKFELFIVTPGVSGGLNYTINNKMSLSLNSNVDFIPFYNKLIANFRGIEFKQSIFTYSLNAGMFIKF